ncbi:MAG: sugar nucleotide-binding protein [candidate division Zixibacteria bacterium]|nr:sugar nucleotide-binding protein [candidate division Zixibacteria bacterium]
MKKRLLITGSAGYLGYHTAFLLHDSFEIAGTFHNNFTSVHPIKQYKVDITDPDSVNDCFRRFEPHWVVHSAAAPDVDWCANNPDEAMLINRDGSKNVALACENVGARMIHISTDLVFDGEKGDYTEDDEVCPNTIYGDTKLAAEKEVQRVSGGFIIFRVALIYGIDSPFKKGYIFSTMDKLRRGEKVLFFTDQFRTPLYVADAANAIEGAIENEAPGGIYHISGDDKVTRLEFGEIMREVYGFDKELIIPSTMDELPGMTARPRDVSMINNKAKSTFGFNPTSIRDALKSILV